MSVPCEGCFVRLLLAELYWNRCLHVFRTGVQFSSAAVNTPLEVPSTSWPQVVSSNSDAVECNVILSIADLLIEFFL